MNRVLVYLKDPERASMHFERLSLQASDITVHTVSSVNELDELEYDANILITIGPHLGPDSGQVYKRLPSLIWVQSIGTGVDNIKNHPDLSPSVTVTNIQGLHGHQLSEAAIASMLVFARQIRAQLEYQANVKWHKMPVTLLSGKTVAILGVGAIARDLAARCRALGMRVIGVSRQARTEKNFDSIFEYTNLNAALSQADYVVVLTPYSQKTRHLLNAGALAHLKVGSFLINLARGGIVDEVALLHELDHERLAGAAMDVFETEPLPANSPFWLHPKVIVTPHAGGFHVDYPEQAFEAISRNLQNYLSGGIAALENKV